jgi:ABC-type spermidine/putrescine transport system permease subunit II
VAETSLSERVRPRRGAWLRRSETARGLALASPAILVLLLTLAAPLALLLLYSLWSEEGLALDTHPTLAQYAKAFGTQATAFCSSARSAFRRW